MKTWVAAASFSLLFISGCLTEVPNPSSPSPSTSSDSSIPSAAQASASTQISAEPSSSESPSQSATSTTTSEPSSYTTSTSSAPSTSHSPPVRQDFLEVQSAPTNPYQSWSDVHVAVSNSSSGTDFLPNFYFALGQEATSSDIPADNQHAVTENAMVIHDGDRVYLCGPSAKAYLVLDNTDISPSTIELTQVPVCP